MKSTLFFSIFSLLLSWTPLHATEAIEKSAKILYELDQAIPLSSYEKIVTFIKNRLDQTQSCYLLTTITGLDCAIEYIKEQNMTLIHLENHAKIDRGAYKRVTRSIVYDQKNPSIFASATGCYDCLGNDLQWADDIKNMQGVAEILASSTHKISCKEKTNCIWTHAKVHSDIKQTIIYKYYNQGSLKSVIFNKHTPYNLSLSDKLKISCEILEGVKNLHKKNIAHADIHPGNILIHKENNTVSAAITDLGGAYRLNKRTRLRNHGHYTHCYSPPEGFFALKEVPIEYYKGFDAYAAGCVLYTIFHKRTPPWIRYIRERPAQKYFTLDTQKRIFEITRRTKQKIERNNNKQPNAHLANQINKIIFSLVTSNYEKRDTAEQALDKLRHLKQH